MTDRSCLCLQSKWIKKVTDDAEQGCHICLVGTKLDLVQSQTASRMVSKEDVDDLAARYQADVFETSAKTGAGVAEIFARIVEHFHSRVQVSTRERCWSGEIFPTELFPGTRETCRCHRDLRHGEQRWPVLRTSLGLS